MQRSEISQTFKANSVRLRLFFLDLLQFSTVNSCISFVFVHMFGLCYVSVFFKVGHIAFIHPGITLEYNMVNICVPEPRLDLTTSRLRVRLYTIWANEASIFTFKIKKTQTNPKTFDIDKHEHNHNMLQLHSYRNKLYCEKQMPCMIRFKISMLKRG